MEDSLAATRSRRSNAGTRLKQLIALEEQSQKQNAPQHRSYLGEDDDDENVRLLFQEDEEDFEFIDEDVDNENLKGIDEEDDEDEDEEGGEQDGSNEQEDDGDEDEEDEATGSRKRKREAADEDDVLSNSDLSDSDSDDMEGEKELTQQEKAKKRSSRSKVIPAIKLVEHAKAKKKLTPLISSKTLLYSDRRSSSRTSALESKQALITKLLESEERYKTNRPVARPMKQVELTQEEKLKEAVETEKMNVQSLNEFRKLEIVKKERQRQLLMSRRAKLKNVIRFVSEVNLITPLDEIKAERRRIESMNVKKKGRKKKNAEDNYEYSRVPGSVDLELPLVKQEMEKKRLEEEAAKKGEEVIEGESVPGAEAEVKLEPTPSLDSGGEVVKGEGDETLEENKDQLPTDVTEGPDTVTEDATTITSKDLPDEEKKEESKEVDEQNDPVESAETVKDTNPVVEMADAVDTADNMDIDVETPEKPIVSEDGDIDAQASNETPEVTVKTEEQGLKQDDEVEQENNAEGETAENDELSKPFEGPVQKVARNTLYLINFDTELDKSSIRKVLIDDKSLLGPSRRFKDLKPLIRIGKKGYTALTSTPEIDELFRPSGDIDESNKIFDELKRLPRLGTQQMVDETVVKDEQESEMPIVIKTEAPTGIYLSHNNNKKICLISGKEVRYFDPHNGIPYDSVETYRVLKDIEQGVVPWYSLPDEIDDFGPVELYLGDRKGMRHASGVPEGFDGV